MISFEVAGIPLAKSKPQAVRVGDSVRIYHKKKNANYQNFVKLRAQEEIKEPLKGPISLKISFLMPRPQRMIWKTKPMFAVPMDRKPDLDNLVKSCLDGLNGVAFLDDRQVAILHATKMYHSGDGKPTTIIELEEIGEERL